MKEKKLENYITNKSINLDRIVDDYTPYLRKIIQNMVGNNLTEEDKEEIMSDAFFILWKKYKENIKINYLDSYLAGITRNLVKEKLKTLKYNIDIEQCKNLIEYSNLETYLQEREEINELYNKISNLKEIDIKIIKMFYYSNKLISFCLSSILFISTLNLLESFKFFVYAEICCLISLIATNSPFSSISRFKCSFIISNFSFGLTVLSFSPVCKK